jgi:hypothetical protein
MKRWLISIAAVVLWGTEIFGQGFDLIDRQENYQAAISETLRIPLRIKNTTDKAQFYIFRKSNNDLGSSQKGYFCLDKNCLDAGIDEFSKRVEPGETLSGLYYSLETGLLTGQNSLKFEIFVRGNPQSAQQHQVNITIDEHRAKSVVFQSKDITIQDVYPNPVSDQAFIDYKIHTETIKAKVVIHNILGGSIGDYELPTFENRIKITTDDLASGIYFYTVYLDNNGVLTRKLIVRK